MTLLRLAPNLAEPDTVYAMLIEAHEGLTTEESHAFNARLILILANHIGDANLLAEAFACARGANSLINSD